jgi:ligand-binding sensor domain-containing protein
MKCPVLIGIMLLLFSIEGRSEWEVHVNSNHVSAVWADTMNVYWGSGHGAVIYNPSSGMQTKLLKSTGGLASNDITALVRDGQNRLWLGTAERGLSVMSANGTWRLHSTGTLHLLSDEVRDVATEAYGNTEVPGSRTVVGTSEGVSLFEDGEFKLFFDATDWVGSGCSSCGAVAIGGDRMLVGTECGCFAYSFSLRTWDTVIPERQTVSIAYDGKAAFWIVTSDSIYTYDGEHLALISKQFIRPDLIYDISAQDSLVWIAGSNGPARYDFASRSWTHVTEGLVRSLWDAQSIYVTPDGVTWIGTEVGAAVLDAGTWVIYASDGPAGNWVQDIEIDRNGKVWCATGSRGGGGSDVDMGILRYDGFEWDRVGKNPLVSGAAYCLDSSPLDGSMFVGFWGQGLMRYDVGAGVWDTLNAGLESKVISDVYVDNDGRLFFGEYGVGLGLLCTDGTLLHYSAQDQPLCIETECITAIGPGPSGAMTGSYLSPSEGCPDRVVELDVGGDCADKNDDACRIWASTQGYAEGNAYVFATDIYGVTWMGTSGGLSSFESRWRGVSTTMGDVWDVAVDSYGTKWVATSGGLYVLEGYGTALDDFAESITKYDSSNSPLDDSPVKALAFDADGALWIGTGGGGIFKFTDPQSRPKRRWVDVFPNPYYSWEDTEGKGIRFLGFMPGRKISIFTIAGDLVAEIEHDVPWQGTNMDGREVVSGVYVYHAYAQDGTEFMGKLVIIR